MTATPVVQLSLNYHYMQLPREVIVGKGTLNRIPEVTKRLGLRGKALVLSDAQCYEIAGKEVSGFLEKSGLAVDFLLVNTMNIKDVLAVQEKIKKLKPQVLLGVGGGTVIDAAKMSSGSQNIPFISIVPGQSIMVKVLVVITTEQEKYLINHRKILVFHNEMDLDRIVGEVKKILIGKTAFDRIVIGLDPGEATGLVALGDGKVIEEVNCFSNQEVADSIIKILQNVDFAATRVCVKVGNGVSPYNDLLEELDCSLPQQVRLEIVDEAGTNKSLKENKRSRGIRHISSATRIAGRAGYIFPRRKIVAAHSRIQ